MSLERHHGHHIDNRQTQRSKASGQPTRATRGHQLTGRAHDGGNIGDNSGTLYSSVNKVVVPSHAVWSALTGNTCAIKARRQRSRGAASSASVKGPQRGRGIAGEQSLKAS
jgi:hypothetical protein